MSADVMRRFVSVVGLVCSLGLAGSGWVDSAWGEPAPPARVEIPIDELPEPPPAVSLLLVSQPPVTVSYTGDYGPMRVTGILTGAPRSVLTLTGAEGERRDINWSEIAGIHLVRIPTAELPTGSFTVVLTSDEGVLPRSTAPATSVIGFTAASAPAAALSLPRRLLRHPQGDLIIQGSPYGQLRVPLGRLTDLTLEPIRGGLEVPLSGSVTMQVERQGNGDEPAVGVLIDVPLERVETLRRDIPRKLIVLTLDDGQIFSGREITLPNTQVVVLDMAGQRKSYPLDQVAQLETTRQFLQRGALISPSP